MLDEDDLDDLSPEVKERLLQIAAELEFRNYLHALWEKDQSTGRFRKEAREGRSLEQVLLDPPAEWQLRPLSARASKLLLEELARVRAYFPNPPPPRRTSP